MPKGPGAESAGKEVRHFRTVAEEKVAAGGREGEEGTKGEEEGERWRSFNLDRVSSEGGMRSNANSAEAALERFPSRAAATLIFSREAGLEAETSVATLGENVFTADRQRESISPASH
jgi:hypothetical protein